MSAEAMAYAKGLTATSSGRPITGTEKCVLLLLADSHNAERGYAWPSVEALSEYSRYNRRTVQRTIHGLVEDDILEIIEWRAENGRQTSNRYRFPALDGARRETTPSKRGAAHNRPSAKRGAAQDRPGGGTDDVEGRHGTARTIREPLEEHTPLTTFESAPNGAVPAQSERDFLAQKRDAYRDSPNKIGVIGEVYRHVIGAEPVWPRLGKMMRTAPGFDNMVEAIQEVGRRNPTDDPMDYLYTLVERRYGDRKQGRRSAPRGTNAAGHRGALETSGSGAPLSRRFTAEDGDGADAGVPDGAAANS